MPAPSSAGSGLLRAAAAVPAAELCFGAAAGPSLMDACNAFCLLALKFVINEGCSVMVLYFFFSFTGKCQWTSVFFAGLIITSIGNCGMFPKASSLFLHFH